MQVPTPINETVEPAIEHTEAAGASIVSVTGKPDVDDALTLFNAANHSYWNMDGSENWAGHGLQIAAGQYLPTTETFAPTGEIADVTGTGMDFRRGR